jgi:alkanesulfonate monooxygenase SsuD/methylene tetrahydromethanopterin reductase-like flavin-dependent oxidoreductase (luciferase family)
MDISLLYELPTGDLNTTSVKRTYDQCIEQVVLADTLGYRTVWFTEHHFIPNFSHSSAPELFLSHLAARTHRIRLGHAIVLLPFKINHPVRVAERIAVLDILSNGRAEFGGGRAIAAAELSGFGIDPDRTRIEWEEALRVLPRIWMDDPFKWQSEILTIPPRSVTPKPLQKPHPPMWVACTQPATIEFAARHGLGVLGFGIGQANSSNYVQLYRDKLKEVQPIGGFVNARFASLIHALCCPTDDEAIALQGPNVKRAFEQSRLLFAPWIEGKPPHSYEWFMKQFEETYNQIQTVSPFSCAHQIHNFR